MSKYDSKRASAARKIAKKGVVLEYRRDPQTDGEPGSGELTFQRSTVVLPASAGPSDNFAARTMIRKSKRELLVEVKAGGPYVAEGDRVFFENADWTIDGCSGLDPDASGDPVFQQCIAGR